MPATRRSRVVLPALLVAFSLVAVAQEESVTKDVASAKSAAKLEPIDFSKVPREVGKLPSLTSKKPLYGLFLFGLRGDTRVWAVLDQSDPSGEIYDRLYFDRNGDGDLTASNERFESEKGPRGNHVFKIGALRDPGQEDAIHTGFEITWTPDSIRYSMQWRGKKRSFGTFGPRRELYQKFAASVAEAPIFVPGYDRPLEFEHWMCDRLTPGQAIDFKVFVGQRGSTRGSFSSVDDKFLPAGQTVQATLIYKDGDGKEQRVRALLQNRC